MKSIFKIVPIAIGTSLLLTGCFSTNPNIISTNPESIDSTPLKMTALSEEELKNWNQADLMLDTIPGMSVTRAYDELLKGKHVSPVIVAVIDSGIDINHEDLKGKIWTNTDEKPNNGIDDDHNGYIDDVHGWNFLGDIVGENMEYTRIIRDYQGKFEGKSLSDFSGKDAELFQLYTSAKAEYEKEMNDNAQTLAQYEPFLAKVKEAHQFVAKKLGKENYSQSEVSGLNTNSTQEQEYKQAVLGMYANVKPGETFADFVAGFQDYVDYLTERKDTHFNVNLNARKVLNDDENDFSKTSYGNNQVGGPDPKLEDAKHGTHVAGIIAAKRGNKKGANGIAEYVQIMPVSCLLYTSPSPRDA